MRRSRRNRRQTSSSSKYPLSYQPRNGSPRCGGSQPPLERASAHPFLNICIASNFSKKRLKTGDLSLREHLVARSQKPGIPPKNDCQRQCEQTHSHLSVSVTRTATLNGPFPLLPRGGRWAADDRLTHHSHTDFLVNSALNMRQKNLKLIHPCR